MPPMSNQSNYLCEITVRHLLEHTTGNWTANLPVYTQPQMNNAQFISYVVSQFPVQQLPGTQWQYSNFGYLLLGEIIATVSGMSYEDYVKQCIWMPSGVTGAFVAGRYISQKGPNEVRN
jgi:D-alanyl-D-alanine carboxypeptidase